jgi:hypothetical protein
MRSRAAASVDRRRAAAVSGLQSRQALAVEAGDEVHDGVATLAADRPGGVLVSDPFADQQQGGAAGELKGGCHAGTAQSAEFAAFGIGEATERILPAAGHGGSQVR